MEGGKGNNREDDTDEKETVWSFVFFSSEKKVKESCPVSIPGEVRIDPGKGSRRGRRQIGGDGGKDSESDTEEKNVERSFVFFSSEEETKEPWLPLLLSLGDIMLHPDPDQLHNTNK